MYVNKVQIAGDYVLVSNYTHRAFGAPHHKRRKKMKDTPKAMADYNRKLRTEKLQLLIFLNFEAGYHVTLDYPKGNRPETYEEAERILKRFLYAMSRKLKKLQRPFKYIAITERGTERAAPHHHMIIEGDPFLLSELTKLWGHHIKISQMYEEGAYKDLAAYFTKLESKEEQTKGKAKYHRSRNLIKPTERSRLIAGKIPEEPDIPPSYELINGSLVTGFNEYVGVRFQKYLIHKTPESHIFSPFSKGVQKGRKGLRHIGVSIKNLIKGYACDYRDLCSRKNKKPSRTKESSRRMDDSVHDGQGKNRKKKWFGLFGKRDS